ncbi:MAG: hypothetical protein ABI388_08420 [Bacteroidia bacterium]
MRLKNKTNNIAGRTTLLLVMFFCTIFFNAQSQTKRHKTSNDIWSGMYADSLGRKLTLAFSDTTGEDILKFSLNMANTTCKEVFEGSAYFETPGTASYADGSGCFVTIVTDRGGISLVEDQKCKIHNASCGKSSGYYKKIIISKN